MDVSHGYGMQRINEDAMQTPASELFKLPELEGTVTGFRDICTRPLTDSKTSPYLFNLTPQGDNCYLQLNSPTLHATCRILKASLEPLDQDDDVSIVDMFPASLFKTCETSFNNCLVSDMNSLMHNYQLFMQTKLSYSKGALNTHLQGQMVIPDDADKFDVVSAKPKALPTVPAKLTEFKEKIYNDRWSTESIILRSLVEAEEADKLARGVIEENQPVADVHIPEDTDNLSPEQKQQMVLKACVDTMAWIKAKGQFTARNLAEIFVKEALKNSQLNTGYLKRRKIIIKSRKFDFCTPLGSDIFNCDRLLHPSVDVGIKLGRSEPGFSLLTKSTEKFAIDISDIRLHTRYVELDRKTVNEHNAMRLKEPMIYPITRTVMKTYNGGSGEDGKYISSIYAGKLPKTMIIGMVESEAFYGSQHKNPWNFQHFNVKRANLVYCGRKLPMEPYCPDFKNNLYMREYTGFLKALGFDSSSDSGNLITPELYKGGLFFLAFDFTGDGCNMFHRHKTELGGIDLDIEFEKPLAKQIKYIVAGHYDACVEIDSSGDCSVNYL